MSEETYTNLDKKLLRLFQTLVQCLGSVEEMLQTPGLFRGDVGTQQVHYEVGASIKHVCWKLMLQAAHWLARTETSLKVRTCSRCLSSSPLADTGSWVEKTLLSYEWQEEWSFQAWLSLARMPASSLTVLITSRIPGAHPGQSCLWKQGSESWPQTIPAQLSRCYESWALGCFERSVRWQARPPIFIRSSVQGIHEWELLRNSETLSAEGL